ncbi:pyridoxamine 5'-phosphate oxidase family protein [Myceligenerans pegani]|uniref:Pyridoxamine 5'-phosphate oxidase family protein n=1 Tax=Myceligenerans pegani TaxID=2776917 RepID=A0ABR9N1I0_9MICO|nr:pyridoxamine 5'-phosphate oxidase family protein [Myceligenerans sp. TRM 65318]MBE1876999.1 pyridoxamine 5'-phosphate oxidase family protein [Myceligenerans sp. TRM 65318]MBE3019270.1 pyridoxamine 5'-phosphate oxidase family protein [Myceligenerans sp. TRM 65318]
MTHTTQAPPESGTGPHRGDTADRSGAAAPSSDAVPSLDVRRLRQRQEHDPEVLREILAEGMFAHVAMVRDGLPVVLPFLYGVGDLGRGPELLLHGSTGGGLFLDAGDDGVPVSVAVTHLDGLVYARSLFDSSANYRSAMIFGRATPVPAERQAEALWMISDHLMPGRRAEVREMTRKERTATQVLRVPLDRASVKVRCAGPGTDDGEDPAVWAGVLPLALRPDASLTDPSTAGSTPVPPSVTALAARLTEHAATRRAALARSLAARATA